MIIGIDGNEANVPNRVGVSWYAFHLLHQFRKQSSASCVLQIFLKSNPLPDLPLESKYFKYIVIPKRTIWSQIDLPLYLLLFQKKLDLFLALAHYLPRIYFSKSVVVIHDLSFFYYPDSFLKKDLYQLKNWTGYSVKSANKIIAVSNNTKVDLIKNYNIEEDRIEVIYNGFDQKTNVSDNKEKSKVKPYFIYIGTIQPRKNLENTILAFHRFLQNEPNYSLYIVGKKGWLFEEIFNLVKQRKLTDKVIFTNYLSEEKKVSLLKQAEALIMPGFYEGFGLPLLEAFLHKIPIIAARSGALPEIARDAALYFEPENVADLVKKMKLVENVKNELISKGTARLKMFSWTRTAKQILDTCRQVIAF
jgi:glycosyltransferase involved in cell wall biosynthesis